MSASKVIPIAKKSIRERIEDLVRDSEISFYQQEEAWEIQLKGEIARIPSLKNSKMPGKNFMNPNASARLQAMTILARRVVPENFRFADDEKLWVIVLLAQSCSRADEDNLFASIKEWLEDPVSPIGFARPWGMGIVKNDKQVNGFALHCKDVGFEFETTRICIRRYKDMRQSVLQMTSEQIIGINREVVPCPIHR